MAFISFIEISKAQVCYIPKDVPYNFDLQSGDCKSLSVFSSPMWVYDLFTFTSQGMVVKFDNDPGTIHITSECIFNEGINLTAGKKYLIDIKYWTESFLKLDYQQIYVPNPPPPVNIVFDALNTPTKCSVNFATYEISPPNTGTYRFHFTFKRRSGSWGSNTSPTTIQELKIREKTCPITISNLQCSHLTERSVKLKWNSSVPASSFDVYCKEVDSYAYLCYTTYPITSVDSSTTKDSITFTGLKSGKEYVYSIRPHCDSTNIGEWSIVDTFSIKCFPETLPYKESFDTNYLPPCASTQQINTNGYNWFANQTGSNGIGDLRIYSDPINFSSTNAWFYTPELLLDSGKNYRLSFNYSSSDTTKIQSLEVKYGLAASNLAMNNLIANFPSFKASLTPTIYSTVFSPTSSGLIRIGFHNFDNLNGGYFNLDDISLTNNNILFVNCFFDKNSNNIKDAGESDFNDAKITTTKNGVGTIVSAIMGSSAIVNIDTGTYTTQVIPYLPYHTTSPLIHLTNLTGFLQADTAIFAIQPIPGKRDLSVHIIPLGNPRPGFTANYQFTYTNQGTDTVQSGTAEIILDNRSSLVSSTPAPTTINGDTLRWSFSGLIPLASSNIFLTLQLLAPPALNLNDVLAFAAYVSSEKPDLTPADDSTKLNQIVRGSFDPNDKIESHEGSILKTEVDNGEFLQYTIRFQNTGNDTAFNVTIKDTLNSQLDWSSFRMLDASHNYQLTITEDNKCEWQFKNINLPDSNINEKLSHGFITFIIKIKTSVVVGNSISNRAAIYFDYNLPVITNTENTSVVANTLPLQLLSFTATLSSSSQVASENIRKVILHWNTVNEVNVNHFEIERSSNGREFVQVKSQKAKGKNEKNEYEYTDPVNRQLSSINSLYYRLKMIDKDGKFSYSPVRYIRFEKGLFVDIFPNPAKDKLQVVVNSDITTTTDMQIQVVTSDGKIANNYKLEIQEGLNNKTIDISQLQRGNYYLKIIYSNKETKTVKFNKL